MPDPRELTNAEINAVYGGQANNIAISQTATATPAATFTELDVNAISPGTFRFSTNVAPGLATLSFSASQSGS
jgi:hypothetical protein